jgi:hypothetical protein
VSRGCTSWNKLGDGSRELTFCKRSSITDVEKHWPTTFTFWNPVLFSYTFCFYRHMMNIYAVCSLKFNLRAFDSYEIIGGCLFLGLRMYVAGFRSRNRWEWKNYDLVLLVAWTFTSRILIRVVSDFLYL